MGLLVDITNDGLHLLANTPTSSASLTLTGTGVDAKNAEPEWMCLLAQMGAMGGTGPAVFSAQESDALASGYVAVLDSKAVTLSAADTIGSVMFQRRKRYVRCVITITGAGTYVTAARFLAQRKIVNASGGGSTQSPNS